jgi:hypothetical protein
MDDNDNQIPTKYIDFLNKIIDKIKQELRNDSSVQSFTFLINNENKSFEIFSGSWQTDEEKIEFSNNLRQQAKKMDADAVCFVSEAWTLTEKYKDRNSINTIFKKYGSVSNCPEKIEVVIISFETSDDVFVGISKIETIDKIKKLGDVKWTKPNSMEGKFANILPKKDSKFKDIKEFIARAKDKFIQNGIDPNGNIGSKSISQILEETIEQMSPLGFNDKLINRMIDSINMMQQHFK